MSWYVFQVMGAGHYMAASGRKASSMRALPKRYKMVAVLTSSAEAATWMRDRTGGEPKWAKQ